jgi:RNA polymerase sigma-70 factor (ECF subfamily)
MQAIIELGTGLAAWGRAQDAPERRTGPAAAPTDAPRATAGSTARMGEQETDHMLVERVQKGDKRAFDLLVRRYQHKVVSVISRYINDWAECQDVAQEAFIRAYRAIGAFRGDSAFYTWVYRIAINTAKNHLVSQGRRPPTDDVAIDDAVQLDAGIRLKDSATPERELLREEIERTVFATVEQLPEELRKAITLREVDGLSYEEIAEQMQCPIGTVRSRIFRAREAIDTQLRPLLTENEVSRS